jgi:cobalt-zinc-cadmium efflux system outer membrane protein
MKEAASMTWKPWGIAVGLLALAGCAFPVREEVDARICDRASLSFDITPPKDFKTANLRESDLALASAQEAKDAKEPLFLSRTKVPATVPGSAAQDIQWFGPKANAKERQAIIDKYFPKLPVISAEPDKDFPPGPDGRPLTLSDLQRIAYANSPLLRQAASDIEAARGAALQAGAYPNPTLGYESSSIGPSGGPSAGMFFQQTIKTFGKLKLARAAAMMDLRVAEYAYRRAETDLMYNVRTNYYAVLVAQESVKANRGLVELTDEVYRVMVDRMKGGEGAPYEAVQLKVFSAQARIALVTTRNQRLLAWRQLAAVLGVPHMPPTALDGQINKPVPTLDFERALAHVLTNHTDVLATAPTIEKARHVLRLNEVTPYPDVVVQLGVANDLSPNGPSRWTVSNQVGVTLPFWDQNKGGIQQAQAALVRANEEPHRVQADLTSRFAEAYRRYEENRILLAMYQQDVLPKQVQAFRLAVKRHFGGGPQDAGAPAFNDLVSSEQLLVTAIGNYIPVLQAQWQAVVDVSNFLQTDQLYQMTDEVSRAPLIDFEELLRMPCHHPCSPALPMPTPDSFGSRPAIGSLTLGAPTPGREMRPSVHVEKPMPEPAPKAVPAPPPVGAPAVVSTPLPMTLTPAAPSVPMPTAAPAVVSTPLPMTVAPVAGANTALPSRGAGRGEALRSGDPR